MGPFTLDRLRIAGLRESLWRPRLGKGKPKPPIDDFDDESLGRFIPPIDSSSAKEGLHPNGASHPSWSGPLNAVKGIFRKGQRGP